VVRHCLLNVDDFTRVNSTRPQDGRVAPIFDGKEPAWQTLLENMDRLVIEAGKIERQYWRDLLRYRELFYFLAWRDILVRYKQTVIGVAWAVLRPLLR
jgi:hypothetical protein